MFRDNNLSKYQWISTKLGICIDIVEISCGIANGHMSSILTELSASHMIDAGYYRFMFLFARKTSFATLFATQVPSKKESIAAPSSPHPWKQIISFQNRLLFRREPNNLKELPFIAEYSFSLKEENISSARLLVYKYI